MKKKRFNYVISYVENVKSTDAKVLTIDVFNGLISSDAIHQTYKSIDYWNQQYADEKIDKKKYEEGYRQAKGQLPAALMQSACIGKRVDANCTPNGFIIIDIDHIDKDIKPADKYQEIWEKLKAAGLDSYVALVHTTPSWHGLRFVVLAPDNLLEVDWEDEQKVAVKRTIKQIQAWWADKMGVERDPVVFNPSRLSFLPKEENILYRNDALLFPANPAEVPSMGIVKLPIVDWEEPKVVVVVSQPKVQQPPVEAKKGTPIDLARVEKNLGVKMQDIVARYWEKTGMPYEGSRNTRLADLAAQVRYVVDYNTEAVTEILRHALPTDVAPLEEAEYQSIARSMCKQERTPMSHLMREILNELKEEQPQDVEGILYPYFAPQPPAMPKRLPKCVYLICNGFEKIYWPAVANSIFPTLGSYCYDLSFDYLDGRTHEMHFMEILFGESGEGKNVITMTDKALSKRMDARDAANRAIIQQWKEETKNSSANSKKKPRPVVPIQRIAPDATGAGYLLQALAAGNLTLHLSLGELSLIRNLSGKNVYEFLCAAFDRDDWGATRAGIDSVDGMVSLRLNFSAACTIWKTLEFLKGHVADGTTSRIGFTYLVSQEIGADMPKLKKFDELFQKNLAPYLDALENTHGNLVCKPALRVAKEMNEEFKQVSVLTYDRAFNNLSRRANVIGYLKGCLLYVANGCKWEKEIEDFMRWSIRNDMWVKMRFFAEEFERETQMPNISRKGPKNLLTFLPDQFTEEEAIRTLSAQGKTEKNVENMLKQWKKRHHIREEKNSSDSKLYIKINSNVMTGK